MYFVGTYFFQILADIPKQKKTRNEPKIMAEINYYYKLYFKKMNFLINY